MSLYEAAKDLVEIASDMASLCRAPMSLREKVLKKIAILEALLVEAGQPTEAEQVMERQAKCPHRLKSESWDRGMKHMTLTSNKFCPDCGQKLEGGE